MIKVKDTKTHKTNIIVKHDLPYIALVTDAELVLVVSQYDAKLSKKPDGILNINPLVGVGLKPILISRIEKIEVGDWYVTTNGYGSKIGEFRKCEDASYNFSNCFKILALPEHFSSKHLQAIVDRKLKEGKALVECEDKCWCMKPQTGSCIECIKLIKLNPHITIYSVEEKMFTRDEVNQVVIKYLTDYSDLEWKEWFEQNVK